MHDSVIDANDMRFDQDSVIQSGRKEKKKKNTERNLMMDDPSTISDPKLGALVCESQSETESIKSSRSLPDSESDLSVDGFEAILDPEFDYIEEKDIPFDQKIMEEYDDSIKLMKRKLKDNAKDFKSLQTIMNNHHKQISD